GRGGPVRVLGGCGGCEDETAGVVGHGLVFLGVAVGAGVVPVRVHPAVPGRCADCMVRGGFVCVDGVGEWRVDGHVWVQGVGGPRGRESGGWGGGVGGWRGGGGWGGGSGGGGGEGSRGE